MLMVVVLVSSSMPFVASADPIDDVTLSDVGGEAPLVKQDLDYTENPIDIPNPDRGPYRGRWQRVATPFGTTPEVDHRVPVDENDVLYHGATLVAPGVVGTVEGDDIELTQFYNGTNLSPNYVGGSGVYALPGVSFCTFDLCNFSSNTFISREAGLAYDTRSGGDGSFTNPDGSPRTGKTQPLTPYALDYIRGLLQKVRDGNGVAFVKFSYDGNGFNYVEGTGEHLIFGPEPNYVTANNPSAMCDVPGHTDKDWIQYHIWQLKPIFQEFEDIIMCVKTGMLGPWGEQHSSPISRTRTEYKKLIDSFLDAVPDSRILLTHVGGYLAWYNLTYGTNYTFTNCDTLPAPPKGSPEARIGFFDDSYAAEWEDNGSLSETGGTSGTYNRPRTLRLIKNQNTIYQGEGGIGNNVYGNMPGAIMEAFEFRTTVLNMRHGAYQRWSGYAYNQANIDRTIAFPNTSSNTNTAGPVRTSYYDAVYNGKNALEYMRDRLGYRLLLRDANVSEWVLKDGVLKFEGKVQNVGFGNVVNKKDVTVILKSKSGPNTYSALTTLDARDWLTAENGDTRAENTAAWRDLNFSINMDAFGSVASGDYDIYLKLNDPKETSANKRCIQFANNNIWNAGLGANKIGSTSVVIPVVPQALNFTENPVDIPNPDRGYYRPTTLVIPVNPGTNPSIPVLSANITGSTVAVQSRIVYMEFDLRNFSSNAPISGRPVGPWSAAGAQPPTYGVTQPLTQAALDYVRGALQLIRNGEAVAIVKFNYDGSGRTYIDATGANGVTYDRHIHDCEPGAPQGREWYDTGRWTSNTSFTGGVRNDDDGCHIPGHEDKNWVQYHLWQLSSVFSEYEDCIMAVKGGIFGPWGEMHSSSYARTAAGYHWLLNALLDYVPDSRSILVHAGGVMAWQNIEYGTRYSLSNLPPVPVRDSRPQRFGMFNDSYSSGSSSRNDNGSLSEGLSLLGSGLTTFNRNYVFQWIRNQGNFYGGETTSSIPAATNVNHVYCRFPSVPYEAAIAQTTHLNTSYASQTNTLWANFVYNEANVTAPFTQPHDNVSRTAIYDPVYAGRNGIEYMRDRLGYRLVLRAAAASESVEQQGGVLNFEGKIQNVGFGLVVNKKNVAVILKSKTGPETYTALTGLDARDWLPDRDSRASNTAAYRDLSFSIDVDEFGFVPIGEYDILLKINDPKETSVNRRCIQFANYNIWNAALGANLIGSTAITTDRDAEDMIDLVIEDGDAVAKFYPINPGSSSINIKYILAVYDAGGKLAELVSDTKAIAGGADFATARFTLSLPIPAGYSAKAFIWDDAYIPITISKSAEN